MVAVMQYGLDRNLKFHSLDGVFDTEDVVEECHPEALSFAFLIALSGPFFDELSGGLFFVYLLCSCLRVLY